MIAYPPNRQNYLKSYHTKVIKPKATSHTSVVYPDTTALEKSLFLIKLNTQVLHDPVIVLLAFISEKWKLISTKKKILYIPAFLVIAPNWR